MSQPANDSFGFFNTGAPSAKFEHHGATITGTITDDPVQTQQTDPDGNLKTYKNGDPMLQLVVSLQTDERDPEINDDDGLRRVFVKGQMRTAIGQALRNAGQKGLAIGGKLTVTYTHDGEKTNPAYSPPKQYVATYEPPANDGGAAFLGTGDQSHGRPQPAVGQGPVPAKTMPPINPQASGIPANLPPGMTPEAWRTLSPEAQAALANMAPAK